MSQAPYSWQFTGNCPSCGSPIYGRVRQPGVEEHAYHGVGASAREMAADIRQALDPPGPEARRTCPPSCPHGKFVSR